MLKCVLHGAQVERAYETRLGSVCLECGHLLIQAAEGQQASAIWILDDFEPVGPERDSVGDELLKWAVDEAEAQLNGESSRKLPAFNAEAHVWAADAFLEGGMRMQAISEAVKAFHKASDNGPERRLAVEVLLRVELLKTDSVENLRRALWG